MWLLCRPWLQVSHGFIWLLFLGLLLFDLLLVVDGWTGGEVEGWTNGGVIVLVLELELLHVEELGWSWSWTEWELELVEVSSGLAWGGMG